MPKPLPNPLPKPIKPRLAINIGVTGHGDKRLSLMEFSTERIQEQLISSFDVICNYLKNLNVAEKYYDVGLEVDRLPIVRLIVCGATGCDTIACKAFETVRERHKGTLHFEIVLIVPSDEDGKRISGLSRHGFPTKMLQLHLALQEVYGGTIYTCYQVATSVLLNHVNILFAFWDEGETKKREFAEGKQVSLFTPGGTYWAIMNGLRRNLPIFCLRPSDEVLKRVVNGMNLIEPEFTNATDKNSITAALDDCLLPGGLLEENQRVVRRPHHEEVPEDYEDNKQRTRTAAHLRQFFDPGVDWFADAAAPYISSRKTWKWLDYVLWILGVLTLGWIARPKAHPERIADEVRPVDQDSSEFYRTRRDVVDRWANTYAVLNRTAFGSRYFLSVVLVLLAVYSKHRWFFPVLEISILAFLMLAYRLSRKYEWHRKWLDYRMVTESLRQMEFLSPLGRTLQFTGLQPVPVDDMVHWTVRAYQRHFGVAGFNASPEKLSEHLRYVRIALRNDQFNYHSSSTSNYGYRAYGLGRLQFLLLMLILMGVFIEILEKFVEAHHELHCSFEDVAHIFFLIPILTIIFPAANAAIEGFMAQGEFENLEQQSGQIQRLLERDVPDPDTPFAGESITRNADESFLAMGDAVENLASLLLAEHMQWRATLLSNQLHLG